MSGKELIFKNYFLEINAEEGTSPFGCEIATMDIHDIAELLFDETQFHNFSWDSAPDGVVAWTMDEDGSAHWWSCVELETNMRFFDWQIETRGNIKGWRVPAPNFGFDRDNWQLSLRKRYFSNKFKIKIEVERVS